MLHSSRSGLKLCFASVFAVFALAFIESLCPSGAGAQVLYNGQLTPINTSTTILPQAIAVLPNGKVYFSNEQGGFYILTPNGNPATTTSYNKTTPYTDCAAVTPYGAVTGCWGFASDEYSNLFYSMFPNFIMENGSSVVQNPNANAVGVDPQGQNIYFTDAIDNLIGVASAPFSSNTSTNTIVSGIAYGPNNLTVDSSENVYYEANSQIWKASAASGYNPVSIFSGINDKWSVGLAVDAHGTVYVSNAGSTGNSPDGAVYRLSPTSSGYVSSVVAGSLNRPLGVAVDQYGNVYVTEDSILRVDKIVAQVPSFGNVNLSSSSVTTLNFTVLPGTTIGSISVLTSGAANLDFAEVNSFSTCTAKTYTSVTNCALEVGFDPTAPGSRAGELIIADASGNTLYSTMLQGTGVGSLPVYETGVQTLLTSSSLQSPEFAGTVSDPSGDLYVAFESQNEILEIASGGVNSVLAVNAPTADPAHPAISATLSGPSAVAIDNGGSLYIADTGNNRIVVRQPVPGLSGKYFLYALPTGSLTLNAPNGVAIDAGGNVYIMDNGNSRVIEVTAAGAASVLPNVNIGNQPVTGFTADGAGNLYLTGNGEVVEYAGGKLPAKILYSGNAQSMAMDAAGDLYIADYQVPAGIVEIPAGGSAETLALASPGGSEAPSAISSDAAGNLYLTYSYGVYELARSAPALSFTTTVVNNVSADSPKTMQLLNAGNQSLSVSSISYPKDFPENTADSTLCASGTNLNPGAVCDISATFKPTTSGPLSESLTVKENSSSLSQSVSLTGTGSIGGQSQTIAIVNRQQVVANICCGVYGSVGATFYVTSSSSLPLTLTVLTGPMTFSGSPTTVVNTTAGSYTFVSSSSRAAGSGIIQATQAGNAMYAPATPVQLTYTVNPLGIDIRTTNPPASGTQVYGGSSQSMSYRLDGVVAGDQVYLVIASGVTPSSPVGNYTANVALAGESASNYTLSPPTTLAFTVTPAPLAVAAEDAYQLVGATPGGFTYTFSGFQNGDTASVVSGAPTFTTTATSSSAAGAFAITPAAGTLSAANYTVSNMLNGELNIFAPINLGETVAGEGSTPQISFPAGPAPAAASAQMLTGGSTTGAIQASAFQCVAGSPGTCTASVAFTPATPGLWTGALQLFDASSPANLLVSIPVYGTATGPQIAFTGGAQSVFINNVNGINGFAFDGSGTTYLIESNASITPAVYKQPAGGTLTAIGSGWVQPTGIVVDGAGNVYVADAGLDEIVKITPAGVQSTLPIGTTSALGALALDASGNVYFSAGSSTVYEITPAGNKSVYYQGSSADGFPTVTSIAFSPAGQMYFANVVNGEIYTAKFGGSATVISSAIPGAQAITIDAAGDIFAISNASGSMGMYELTSTGTTTKLISAVDNALPLSLALDPAGNAYMGNSFNNAPSNPGQIVKLDRADAPAVTFSTATPQGTLDTADGPATIKVANIGNQPLVFSTPSSGGNPTYPANFPENTADTNLCAAATSLAAGATCDVSLNFMPSSVGANSGSIVLTENGADNSTVTQTIAATGTGGSAPAISTTTALSLNPNPSAFGQTVTATATVLAGGTPVNEGLVQFSVDGAVQGGSIPLSSGTAQTTLNGLTPGSHNVSAAFSDPSASTYSASTGSVTLPVNQASQTITFTQPSSPVYYPTAPVTLVATGGASGNPVTFSIVSGPGSLSGAHNTVLALNGVGTIVIAANQAGNTDYAAAAQVTNSLVVNVTGPAVMAAPNPGTTFTGSAVTFTWNSVGEPFYSIHVGTTGAGSSNIAASGNLTTTSFTVNNVPNAGAQVNVRLYTFIAGTWQYNDYIYVEENVATPAVMSAPAPNSTLTGPSAAFTWTAGSSVTEYLIHVGTTGPGSSNVYNSSGLHTTSATVTGIPVNGAPLNVRLYSYIANAWQYNDYTYTEYGTPTPAVMSAPAPGSTLTGSSAAFTWTAGIDVADYLIHVGTAGAGSSNIYSSGTLTSTNVTVNGIPTSAAPLNVRLYSFINGAWQYNDYTYTEYGVPAPAVMTTPAPNSTLAGSSATFTWTAGSGVTAYLVHVGTTGAGSSNIYSSGTLHATSATVGGIPTTGGTLNVRLYSYISGAWQFNDYTYTEQ